MPRKNSRERGDFVPNPCEEPKEKEELSEEKLEQINEAGSVMTCRNDRIIHCLTVIGQIEGHYLLSPHSKTTKYEHIIPLLVSVEEDPRIDGLLILLNTVGGDVEAGLAIAEVISGMLGVPQTFEYFRRMQDRITNFVVENSSISRERYDQLVLNTGELVMDVGTILDGESAVAEGLIDSVGNVSEAIDALYEMIDNNSDKEK